MHFAIYKTAKNEYSFSILGDDFKIICSSDPTPDKESVFHAIEIIKMESANASTLDFS